MATTRPKPKQKQLKVLLLLDSDEPAHIDDITAYAYGMSETPTNTKLRHVTTVLIGALKALGWRVSGKRKMYLLDKEQQELVHQVFHVQRTKWLANKKLTPEAVGKLLDITAIHATV